MLHSLRRMPYEANCGNAHAANPHPMPNRSTYYENARRYEIRFQPWIGQHDRGRILLVVFCVLCSVFCVLCSVFSALCSTASAQRVRHNFNRGLLSENGVMAFGFDLTQYLKTGDNVPRCAYGQPLELPRAGDERNNSVE